MKMMTGLFVAAAGVAGWQEADESIEPPMIFHLEIDGRKLPVELDKPVELPGKDGPVKATLRAERHREFVYGGMRFNYPRHMAFEADFETESLRSWTLDGNDAVVMIHRHLGNEDHEQFRKDMVAEMVRQYGRGRSKSEATALELEGRKISGTKVTATIVESKLVQSVYSWKDGKDTVVLVFQDAPDEDEEATAEFRSFLKMFTGSFKFREAKK